MRIAVQGPTLLANEWCRTWIQPMTVALARDVEELLQDQVRAGVCTDGSQLVNDLLRSLCEQQERTFEGGAELERLAARSCRKAPL